MVEITVTVLQIRFAVSVIYVFSLEFIQVNLYEYIYKKMCGVNNTCMHIPFT